MRVLKTAAAMTVLCAALSACAMDLTPRPQYPVVAPAPAPEPTPAPAPAPAPAPPPADPDTPKAAPSTPVQQSTLPPPPGAKVAAPRKGSALEPRYQRETGVVDVMMFAAAAADSSVTVGKGDTLAKIAKKAGVSIDDLAKANKIEPPYKLKLGQTLSLPGAAAPEPTVAPAKGKKGKAVSRAELKPEPKAPETVTVGKGDNLAKIAKTAGVSLEDLAKANDIAAPYRVKAGQVLTLPGSEPAASSAPKAEGRKAKAPAPTSVTVGKGQTLQSIADKQGVPVAELAKLNHLKKPYRVKRGQVIKLPTVEDEVEASAPSSSRVSSKAAAKSTPPRVVTAGKRDTLQSIADKAGAPVSELAKLNHLKKPYRIKRGQKIKIPGHTVAAEPEAAPTSSYTVKKGDTLYSIARKFSTEPRTLAAANDIDIGTHLNVGRRLKIPGGPLDKPIPTAGGRRRTDAEPSQPEPYSSLPPNPGAGPNPPYTPPPTYPSRSPPLPIAPQPYTRPAPTPEASAAPPSLADTDVAAAGKGLFQWPVRGPILLPYGPRRGGQRNDGMDIGAAMNEPVHAAAAGEVVYAGNSVPGFGNLVLIRHDGGWVTVYAHMANIDVKMRQTVTQGQQIGQVGQTGGVDQPQLHFEVRYAPNVKDKARQIDPMLVLPQ